MRWRDGRRSSNVEDYRGRSSPGGGMGLRLGFGGLIAVAAAWFFGIDPRLLLGLMEATQGVPSQVEQPQTSAPQDEAGEFVSVVLADTEDTWSQLFSAQGRQYEAPRLRLFSGRTQSGCGAAGAEVGPFYCPADQRVYLDLGFFRELSTRFDAPGDFAQAYVIAHEVGHHVQNLLGTANQVRSSQRGASELQANQLQVRMELQADCYAGIWAHHAQRSRQILESGDLEEALGAAAAVGDDLIQKRTQGTVVPESFTHGSAAQRQKWFERGFQQGTVAACDTFGARSP
ncbi:MAG: neutral zinc metallopeptidase [Steroidobacteraceae bacterium]